MKKEKFKKIVEYEKICGAEWICALFISHFVVSFFMSILYSVVANNPAIIIIYIGFVYCSMIAFSNVKKRTVYWVKE